MSNRKQKRGRPSKKHLTCKAKGCSEGHRARGFCMKHYQKDIRARKKAKVTTGEIMEEEDKGTKPGSHWFYKEERALQTAMEKVDKNPHIDGKPGKRDTTYWNEVAAVLRLDSKGKYNRGGHGCEVHYNEIARKTAASNFEEETTANPVFSDHWTKIGGEIVQIRNDVSQTYETVSGIEYSVARLEEEMARMRTSVQSIEEMIDIVFRSYGLKKGDK